MRAGGAMRSFRQIWHADDFGKNADQLCPHVHIALGSGSPPADVKLPRLGVPGFVQERVQIRVRHRGQSRKEDRITQISAGSAAYFVSPKQNSV